MEIFIVLILIALFWLIFNRKNSNILSNSKYKADLAKQKKKKKKKEKFMPIVIILMANGGLAEIVCPLKNLKKNLKLKKLKEAEDILKIKLKMEDLIGGIFNEKLMD